MANTLSKQLAHLNLAVCTEYRQSFGVERPHNLAMIEKQLDQLADKPAHYRASHLAYMLNKLQPFANQNTKTACLAVKQYLNDSTKVSISLLAQRLMADQDVETLAESLATA